MPLKYCVCNTSHIKAKGELNNDFTIQPLTQTLDELLVEYRKCVVLKSVENGEIIGFVRAYADGDIVYIGMLIMHLEHQGKVLEQRLHAEIEGKISRKRFELFTSKKSQRNLHLYEKSGYKRFKEETDESGIAFVYMEKQTDDDETNVAVGYVFGGSFRRFNRYIKRQYRAMATDRNIAWRCFGLVDSFGGRAIVGRSEGKYRWINPCLREGGGVGFGKVVGRIGNMKK
ncbi:MAG: GNAT family N-acetyltransferase [Oscillospiraceae bacterium]|nr:GNAT family N-acetyltransferase [Oscillospiraceae bacterium]